MEPYLQLEKEFGEYIGNPNTVACSSGTAALHLALEAFRFPIGTTVFVPDFTMVACARAVTLAGLEPAFMDCREDLLTDPSELWRIQNSSGWAGAIMPVHIYGRKCDMGQIAKLAALRDLRVIEDLAEAHGVMPHPNTDAACWSFYKNKIICGEEGGMVAFKNPEHAAYARQLRSLGFTHAHDFMHRPRGMNYRMANLLAEPIIQSLRHVESNLAARARVEKYYDSYMPDSYKMPARKVCWVYDVRIPGLTNQEQDRIVNTLNSQGIAARHAFKPMSHQPEYTSRIYSKAFVGPVAERASREVIYLPVQPNMDPITVNLICTSLVEAIITTTGHSTLLSSRA